MVTQHSDQPGSHTTGVGGTPDAPAIEWSFVSQTWFGPLVEDLRGPFGVIPWVGAGLSVPAGFPTWRVFLTQLAERAGCREETEQYLDKGEFEQAAEELYQRLGDGDFNEAIRATFWMGKRSHVAPLGPVELLPRIWPSGPIITTNIDRVLEHAYHTRHKRFGEYGVVCGVNGDRMLHALHSRHERHLLKIHGDVADRVTRVLTLSDYTRQYKSMSLEDFLCMMFPMQPVLFLGCSLQQDRTLEILQQIRSKPHSRNSHHYALLPMLEDDRRQRERRRLLSDCGVRPIWYPRQHRELVRGFLDELLRCVQPRARSGSHRAPPSGLQSIHSAPGAEWIERIEAVEMAIRNLDRSVAQIIRLVESKVELRLGPGELMMSDAFVSDQEGQDTEEAVVTSPSEEGETSEFIHPQDLSQAFTMPPTLPPLHHLLFKTFRLAQQNPETMFYRRMIRSTAFFSYRSNPERTRRRLTTLVGILDPLDFLLGQIETEFQRLLRDLASLPQCPRHLRRPLLDLIDPASGRTIAYLQSRDLSRLRVSLAEQTQWKEAVTQSRDLIDMARHLMASTLADGLPASAGNNLDAFWEYVRQWELIWTCIETDPMSSIPEGSFAVSRFPDDFRSAIASERDQIAAEFGYMPRSNRPEPAELAPPPSTVRQARG